MWIIFHVFTQCWQAVKTAVFFFFFFFLMHVFLRCVSRISCCEVKLLNEAEFSKSLLDKLIFKVLQKVDITSQKCLLVFLKLFCVSTGTHDISC